MKIQIRRKWPLLFLSLFLFFLFLIHQKLVLNITPSLPEGIYLKTDDPIERGSIVSLCLDSLHAEVGLKNHYIMEGNGECSGFAPLIKKVIAVPRDRVVLEDNFIQVNGEKYPYPTHYQDSLHRKLDVYARGTYNHTTGYWVIGSNATNSWDSRYWGPITKNQILHEIKPLLTWK